MVLSRQVLMAVKALATVEFSNSFWQTSFRSCSESLSCERESQLFSFLGINRRKGKACRGPQFEGVFHHDGIGSECVSMMGKWAAGERLQVGEESHKCASAGVGFALSFSSKQNKMFIDC